MHDSIVLHAIRARKIIPPEKLDTYVMSMKLTFECNNVDCIDTVNAIEKGFDVTKSVMKNFMMNDFIEMYD